MELLGATDIVTGGFRDTVAFATCVGSAALVAVIVTDCEELIIAGAVYKPVVEIVPTAGLTDQVTAVFVVPETVPVNCWLCDADRLAVAGLMLTATGATTVTEAMSCAVGAATLVAVTDTVCVDVTEFGGL